MTNWLPISEYDEMDPADRPRFAVFYYPAVRRGLTIDPATVRHERSFGMYTCTLWLPLDDPGQTIDEQGDE